MVLKLKLFFCVCGVGVSQVGPWERYQKYQPTEPEEKSWGGMQFWCELL